jgi:hypothetical protein
MALWILLGVLVVGLLAALLYDQRVRARRGRLGDVDGAARTSQASTIGNPDAHRQPFVGGW